MTKQQAIENALIEFINERENTHSTDLPGIMKAINVPGMSFVFFEEGEIVASGTYGLINAHDTRQIRPDTLFQAASNSKSIAALTCLRMVEAGLLDLDADVNDYLTLWKVPPVEAWQPVITLRQLLTHTAATTVHGFWGYRASDAIPTVTQILSGDAPSNSPAVVLDGLPSHSGRYSGGGTTIAQLVMMDVSGKSFPELADEWVLKPLEMTDSGFMQPLPPEKYHQAAHGHLYTGDPMPERWNIHPELAAAGLWTTPTDMSKFARAIQSAKQGNHPVISQQVVEWMLTPVFDAGEVQHGSGVFLHEDEENLIFGHGGANIGYQCFYNAYVDGRAGFSVMTNSDRGGIFCNAFREYHIKAYSKQKSEESPEIDLTELVGTYKNDEHEVKITLEGETLHLHWNQLPPLKLSAKSKDELSITVLKRTLTIERDDNDTLSSILIKQSGHSQTLKPQNH